MNEPFTLARLLAPFDRARFVDEHWERKPLIVRRADRAYWRDLLTADDVNRVLTTRNTHHPAVGMTNAARKMAPEEFTYPSGLIDTARLYRHFAEGSTITLNGFETEHPALALLCRSMERELSIRFQTNLYFTPAQAQGFRTHYDSHDVFVLQVHGSKHWTLYDTPVELPYRRQEFNPAEFPVGPVSAEFVLEQGDMAYVPRGVMHDARTTGEESLHVTLGVLFTSYTDLLVEALAMVGLGDPAFRRGLPPGFARPGFDRAALREELRALARRFADKADVDGALEHFIDDVVDTRQPLLPGQVDEVRALGAIADDTALTTRPAVLYRLHEAGDEVVLQVYGSRIRFPAHVREALAWLMEQPRFTPADLPGTLDAPGRLILVRRLVREGVLMRA
ncbi:MAG: cupin domain-containing protein [Polyangiales bacterium]